MLRLLLSLSRLRIGVRIINNLIARVFKAALIRQDDAQTLIQKRHLLQARTQRLKIELNRFENFRIRVERLSRSRRICLSATGETLAHNMAAILKRHVPLVALTLNAGIDAARKRVHNRNTNTVKTTRNRVTAAAELTASVQNRHDDLDGRTALRRVHIHRNTTAVILNTDATIVLQCHADRIRITCQRLIDRVVHDLVHEVVQTTRASRTDIHAGALTNSLETLKHRNRRRTIFLGHLTVPHMTGAFMCLTMRLPSRPLMVLRNAVLRLDILRHGTPSSSNTYCKRLLPAHHKQHAGTQKRRFRSILARNANARGLSRPANAPQTRSMSAHVGNPL